MDILPDGVEDQISAVRQLAADGQPIFPEKPHKRLHAQCSQIPGDDEVIILRRGAGIRKMGLDGVIRSGGKCQG